MHREEIRIGAVRRAIVRWILIHLATQIGRNLTEEVRRAGRESMGVLCRATIKIGESEKLLGVVFFASESPGLPDARKPSHRKISHLSEDPG